MGIPPGLVIGFQCANRYSQGSVTGDMQRLMVEVRVYKYEAIPAKKTLQALVLSNLKEYLQLTDHWSLCHHLLPLAHCWYFCCLP